MQKRDSATRGESSDKSHLDLRHLISHYSPVKARLVVKYVHLGVEDMSRLEVRSRLTVLS